MRNFVAGLLLGSLAALAVSSGGRHAAPVSDQPRVTGIGGVFFKADDPQKLSAWHPSSPRQQRNNDEGTELI